MKIQFNRLNHIQICIPHGQETKAREFYCGILGLVEIEKPERMKKNGGFWLEIADFQIHIGTEDLQGKSKRHPAFEVSGLQEIKNYLLGKKVQIVEQQNVNEFMRFSLFDFFGNRIELMEKW